MPNRARQWIGDLRERVTLKTVARSTVDAEGQSVVTETDIGTCGARCEYLEGRELEMMQKINAAIQVRMTLPYRTDITETSRIVWRGATWNIHALLPDEDKFFMKALVSRVH